VKTEDLRYLLLPYYKAELVAEEMDLELRPAALLKWVRGAVLRVGARARGVIRRVNAREGGRGEAKDWERRERQRAIEWGREREGERERERERGREREG